MRRNLFVYILVFLLCFSACSAPLSDIQNQTTTTSTNSSTLENTQTEPEESAPIEPGYFPIHEEPAEFVLSSGSDDWSTILEINRDGTFSGQYLNLDMNTTGDGYSCGSAHICDFSGVFTDIEKINAYTYQVCVSDMAFLQAVGKEWIDDEIFYIASNPVGIYNPESQQICEEFILYLPDTPIDQLSPEFLSSWPYQDAHQSNPKTTLSCYGLLNVTTNDVFFYTEQAQ